MRSDGPHMTEYDGIFDWLSDRSEDKPRNHMEAHQVTKFLDQKKINIMVDAAIE
jgi:hypothetical protein